MIASTGRAGVAHAPQSDEPDGLRTHLAALLSAGLAHEVRNPLNAMAIHLEVLSDKLRGEAGRVPPELERNLAAARAQIGRVDEMVRRFSDFAAARAPAGADLAGLLCHAVALCEHDVRRRGAAMALEAAPAVPVAPPAAPLLLLLVSLLHGWGEAVPSGGRIVITASAAGGSAEVRACIEGGERLPPPAPADLELARTLGATLHEEDGFVLRLPVV